MTFAAVPVAVPVAVVALATWAWLLLCHGGFWRDGPFAPTADRADGPPVAVVVPARDEARDVEASLRSLLAQDYRGPLRVWLVDDGSSDGTGAVARRVAASDRRLVVLDGQARPPGWSGKLWAVSQGLAEAAPWAEANGGWVLLTDADIVHDPSHLGSLVSSAARAGDDLRSEMVALRCRTLAERALVPAFVFFFQLLYPFRLVASPASRVAAAAGGVILLRASTLRAIGGIGAVRGALIDDVALARAVKGGGFRVWLGHARLARSLRPYPGPADIWRMVARTAYVQLRFSPALLFAATTGMALLWLAPLGLAAFGGGWARAAGAVALVLSLASFVPTLNRFRVSPLWALALPGVALFYMAATLGSALDHHRGRGVVWRNRAYAPDEAASLEANG